MKKVVCHFWTIRFKYNDHDKWTKVLSFVDLLATQSVKRNLQQKFETSLAIEKKKRDFKLEDIDMKIENAKRDFEKEMEETELNNQFRYLC